jgi:DNA-binding MarR family transcriptional regulator
MPGLAMELISRAHLVWKRRIARNLVPYGTNPKQLFVLRKLVECPLAPSAIADLVHADRPTATSLIGTMERARWVSRSRDPNNGKRVIVQITGEGRNFLASVPEVLWRTGKMSFDPEACLTKAERAELVRLLKKVNDSLDNSDEFDV